MWLGTTYKSSFGVKKQTYTRKDEVYNNNWRPFSLWKTLYNHVHGYRCRCKKRFNICTAILDQVGRRMWTNRILFFSFWIYRFCSRFDKVVFQLFIRKWVECRRALSGRSKVGKILEDKTGINWGRRASLAHFSVHGWTWFRPWG